MEEKSLILEGLPDDFHRVKPKVELYFRNKRRSGGETLQIREHPDDKRKALLVYIRDEDLKKVLDKRIHKVDIKPHGSVEVTVKLPEETQIKIKPQVLPKPRPETLALRSSPAAARQVIIRIINIRPHASSC
ncbi:protein mono-ADP-ribosyltransferase PARP14-like [Carassius gibelio]|uniref:protein mono-ADP-ribosyltransferase PARP14-like n=1 Tax=Carassius gibelio TaxID=101364 RepID=UPI00227752C8|nr:protein mono-ADP-ribosyltransferase PARP14-like [Carassius gibelio]